MTETPATTDTVGVHDAEVDALFAATGRLAEHITGFRSRQSQTDMARAVAQAISTQSTLLAEAGTGTGKTFAYLVPALLWGGKVIVSTGTRNLQDQLTVSQKKQGDQQREPRQSHLQPPLRPGLFPPLRRRAL